MILPQPLIPGTLVQRYKRFLADIKLEDSQIITAHCPNSGSMKSCKEPGSPVFVSTSDNQKRKLKYTWQLVKANGVWVGINTHYPNKLVKEGILDGIVKELQGYRQIRSEVKYGTNSRIDLLLESEQDLCYVEVKNVTLVEENTALFPDAVTVRGQKHLKELVKMRKAGHRAVIFFVVQRSDGKTVVPADEIDPEYGALLRWAVENGVEALAYQAFVSEKEIYLSQKLPVKLNLI